MGVAAATSTDCRRDDRSSHDPSGVQASGWGDGRSAGCAYARSCPDTREPAGLRGLRAARPVLLPVGEGWWVCGQPVQLGTAGELPVQLLGVLPEIGDVLIVIVPFSR